MYFVARQSPRCSSGSIGRLNTSIWSRCVQAWPWWPPEQDFLVVGPAMDHAVDEQRRRPRTSPDAIPLSTSRRIGSARRGRRGHGRTHSTSRPSSRHTAAGHRPRGPSGARAACRASPRSDPAARRPRPRRTPPARAGGSRSTGNGGKRSAPRPSSPRSTRPIAVRPPGVRALVVAVLDDDATAGAPRTWSTALSSGSNSPRLMSDCSFTKKGGSFA